MTGFSKLDNSFLGLLSAVLPNPAETELLQACLWFGEPGAEAWRKWSSKIADPTSFLRHDKDGVKGLLPLLFDSLQVNGIIVEGEFRTYLRTAYLRDELRSRTYSRICRELVNIFSGAGIPAVILKGAALAETCYKRPSLQHAHYLDILIKTHDLNRAVEMLHRNAFSGASVSSSWDSSALELIHESGLPLVLHRHLFRFPFYCINMDEIWARSRTEMICSVPSRLLCATDNLFHICGSVFDVESYQSLRWVCDAWFLIQRSPNLDWNLLLNCAMQSRTTWPLLTSLAYLAHVLNAPIPSSFLAGLQTAALKAPPIEREAALFAVQVHARGGLKRIMRQSDNWRMRCVILKWALVPSPEYMRRIYKAQSVFLLPLSYVYRPLKYLSRATWFACKRVVRRRLESFRILPAEESRTLS